MNRTDVDAFEKLVGQLEGLYEEVSLLSKKAPNDALSVFKLSFVNKLLGAANKLLGKTYRPFEDFDAFDPDNVPQNSDVVFILAQYLQCCEKMRADNVTMVFGSWNWKIKAKREEGGDEKGYAYLPTVRPKKLRE